MVSVLINNSGRAVNNHIVHNAPSGAYLQSYASIVAYVSHDRKEVLLGRSWNFSRTTVKYVRQFIAQLTGLQYTSQELQQEFEVVCLESKRREE